MFLIKVAVFLEGGIMSFRRNMLLTSSVASALSKDTRWRI